MTEPNPMTENEHRQFMRNVIRNHTPRPEPPSAELEQDALDKFGEEDELAVKAIFFARRHETFLTFFVEPFVAAFHGLSEKDMTQAMDRLEGRLIETVSQERGEPREVRLLPDWENPNALAEDISWIC